MTIKLGINGFGRIGRIAFRLAQDLRDVEVTAINDLVPLDYLIYLLKYDSTHGCFEGAVSSAGKDAITVQGRQIRITSEADPKQIDWGAAGVDILIEATGRCLETKSAQSHLDSGARKVLITAPPKEDIPMFVYGVNHETYSGQKIFSNASCTTNCLAPLVKVIDEIFGFEEGFMSTIHATTATQKTVDGPSGKDWRSGRGAIQNIIPAATGAAKAVGKVLPSVQNRLTGVAFRVPIADVSVVDLTCRIRKAARYEEICSAMKAASRSQALKGVLGYTEEPLVSSDFLGASYASIFDAKAGLGLNDHFFKLVSWYDNEVGYSQQLLRLATYVASCASDGSMKK